MSMAYCPGSSCGVRKKVRISFRGEWEYWYCADCGTFLGRYRTR